MKQILQLLCVGLGCLLAVPLVVDTTHGQASGSTYTVGSTARVGIDFTTVLPNTPVFGTGYELTVFRLFQSPADTQIGDIQLHIHHDVLFSDSNTYQVVGGILSRDSTRPWHYPLVQSTPWEGQRNIINPMQSFMWSNAGQFATMGGLFSVWGRDRAGTPPIGDTGEGTLGRLEMFIERKRACNYIHGGAVCTDTDDRVTYTLRMGAATKGFGPHNHYQNYNMFKFPTAGAYPVLVQKAKHGVRTMRAPLNQHDVHVAIDNDRYYTLDEQCTCGTTWPPLTSHPAWPSHFIEEDAANGFLVWSSSNTGMLHACLGLAPGTPCGCLSCGGQSFSPSGQSASLGSPQNMNFRWLPTTEPALLYYLDDTSLPGGASAWSDPAATAEAYWETAAGYEVLRRTGSLGDEQVIVGGDQLLIHVQGETRWVLGDYSEVNIMDWECRATPVATVVFAEMNHAEIVVQSDASRTEWSDDDVYRAGGDDPGQANLYVMGRSHTMIHEFGHVLGIDHEISFDCPKVSGTPGAPLEFHGAVCSPLLMTGTSTPMPYVILPANEGDALECLLCLDN